MNTRYRDYALYVLYSRAIPSCIDGFKPSQRKVLWVAEKIARGSKIKTAALSGAVTEKANYHHGGTDGVASLMAAAWCNNVPILTGEGNFGSRMINPASASRYTFVKLSKDFDRYFTDQDILEGSNDPEDPEPRFYLPLIPWVLVNGADGIAIGFATEIQPRDPKVLAKLCLDYGSGKMTREELLKVDIPPYFEGFRGTVDKRDDGRWVCRGTWNRKSKTQIEVTELPMGVDREKYVTMLDKYEEQGKITSYEDPCEDGKFRFVIRFPKETDLDTLDVTKFLRLEKALSENITTIDENGNLKIFESASALLAHFCDYRVKQYQRRFAAWIDRDMEKLRRLDIKRTFIREVIHERIKLGGCTKANMKERIKRGMAENLTDEDISMLMDVRTYDFCEDSMNDADAKIQELQTDITTWHKAKPDRWFKKELEALL